MMEAAQTLSDYELERRKPMPSRNHSMTQLNLIAAFLPHKKELFILPELSLELDGQPFVPDICLYRRFGEEAPEMLDWQHDEIRMTAPPLIAVEILSPTQPSGELMRKTDAYLAAGVKSCWIVQPAFETITVFEPGQKPATYSAGEVTDPTTGITIQVEEVFQPLQ
jgi:Uma2 family endonuclease